MKEHYCSICGKSTEAVEYEYLIGFDHLSCHLHNWNLTAQVEKVSSIQIKGWDKINGFTYKGYTIVNPIHNSVETKYMADVLNLNLPQKPKCELTVIADRAEHQQFNIALLDLESNNTVNISANKDMMSSIKGFRTLFEDIVEKLIVLNDKNLSNIAKIVTPSSHSFATNITAVNATSIGIDYSKVMAEFIDAIKQNHQMLNQFKDLISELETLK